MILSGKNGHLSYVGNITLKRESHLRGVPASPRTIAAVEARRRALDLVARETFDGPLSMAELVEARSRHLAALA